MVKKTKKLSKKISKIKTKIPKNTKKQNKEKRINVFKRSFNFLKEIKSELKKVVWPSKKGLLNGTLTVFSMVIIVALIVVVADFIFRHLLKILLGIM